MRCSAYDAATISDSHEVAVSDGVAQREALDLAAGDGEIVQVGGRQGDHAEAELRFADDDALFDQALQPFANGADAAAVPLGELGERQPRPGQQTASEDVAPQSVVDLLGSVAARADMAALKHFRLFEVQYRIDMSIRRV